MARILSTIYTLILIALLEIAMVGIELWWLIIVAWLLTGIVALILRRLVRVSWRALMPLIMVVVLLAAAFFFIETSVWRHAVAVAGSLIVGGYTYLLLTAPLAEVAKRYRDLLALLNLLLAAGVSLSLNVFLRAPWYVSLALFILLVGVFSASRYGGGRELLPRARWLPLLAATELYAVMLILPINIFSRAAVIGFGYHLVSLARRAPKVSDGRLLAAQQIGVGFVLVVLVLVSSRWI